MPHCTHPGYATGQMYLEMLRCLKVKKANFAFLHGLPSIVTLNGFYADNDYLSA